MARSLSVKVGGSWRTVAETITYPSVKISGTWRSVIAVHVKVGGVWKQTFNAFGGP